MQENQNLPPVNDSTGDVTDAKIEAVAEVVTQLVEDVATLKSAGKSATIGAQKPKPAKLIEFALGKDQYRFRLHGFSLDGSTVIQCSDLVKDKARLKEIVEKYPGIVEKI